MIDRTHELSIRHQCELLGLPRSSVYYRPRQVPLEDLALMRRLDELHLEFPYAGSRMLRDLLRLEGHQIGRKRVRRLMRAIGIAAVYRKPRTTLPNAGHQVFPYLLSGLTIERPNQVWASDITYIPMARGFVYLCAVMDWHSRRVLAWRLSNTLTTDFCTDALQEAIARYGAPEIFNTDQGSQFTSAEFTGVLKEHGVRISMDGKGRWLDNVFVERLWRSVKYEEVYLHAYADIGQARSALTRYFATYNARRPHQALDGRTPDAVYFDAMPTERLAA
jgi:putative transposase